MTTIVAIRSNNGVILSSDRRASKGFFIGSKITQKIYKVDDTLGMAIAGQLYDAEYMIKMAIAERKLTEARLSIDCERISQADCKSGLFRIEELYTILR